jgi:hypothetical protein
VVPGRAHERVGVANAAGHHGVDGLHAAAGGERRDLIAPAAERREATGVTAAGGALGA